MMVIATLIATSTLTLMAISCASRWTPVPLAAVTTAFLVWLGVAIDVFPLAMVASARAPIAHGYTKR